MTKLRRRSLLALAGVTPLLALAPTAAHASTADTTVPQLVTVVSGLNNPRHLLADGDRVWVAEGGTGGTLQCVSTPDGQRCLGMTGAVTLIQNGQAQQVITGLPSIAAPNGGFAVGPAQVSLAYGHLTLVESNLAAAVDPVTGGNPFGDNGTLLGRLLQYDRRNPQTPQVLADFGVYEAQNNPDGGAGAAPGAEHESNPYSMVAYRGGFAVIDAGANDLLWVDPFGTVHTLAVFPTETINGRVVQAAPTAVKVGPDGALYVSAFSVVPGSARVYRVVPGQDPQLYASGFTLLTDLAFDSQGRLLVLSMSTTGTLFPPNQGEIVRVEPDGTQTHFAPAGLIAPTGLAVSGCTVYVSNQGVTPGAGEVDKLYLP